MPKKKSVKRCAQEFRKDTNNLLEFCKAAESALSDAHVSLVYDGAIVHLYAAFERMILEALVGAINNDTSKLSSTTSVQFPKHLTDEVCEYIVIGNGYFNFRGRSDLIREIRKYVPQDHYLVEAVKDEAYTDPLNRIGVLRNWAAHNSKVSKRHALTEIGQKKGTSSGAWLKRQNRFARLVESLGELSKKIEEGAPY